jgi:hypothetical protein
MSFCSAVDQLAGSLDCGIADLPLKYLGLLLGVSSKLKAIWRDLEDLMDRRLAPWKRTYFSKEGGGGGGRKYSL